LAKVRASVNGPVNEDGFSGRNEICCARVAHVKFYWLVLGSGSEVWSGKSMWCLSSGLDFYWLITILYFDSGCWLLTQTKTDVSCFLKIYWTISGGLINITRGKGKEAANFISVVACCWAFLPNRSSKELKSQQK
jgi:hypothetical protein